jgi:hypothetical protein
MLFSTLFLNDLLSSLIAVFFACTKMSRYYYHDHDLVLLAKFKHIVQNRNVITAIFIAKAIKAWIVLA